MPGLQASSSLNSGLGMQDGPAEQRSPGLGSGAQLERALPLPLLCRSDGCPVELSGREGGSHLSRPGHCVPILLPEEHILGGVGQLVGNLQEKLSWSGPERIQTWETGAQKLGAQGAGEEWEVKSLKSGLCRARSGARICLPRCLFWCLSPPPSLGEVHVPVEPVGGCGFVCRIKPICVHSGGGVVSAPGRDSILTTRSSHLPPRGAQI